MNCEIINYLDNVKYNDIDIKYKEFDLVFSGGGLKGFYHIGICKILKYHEIHNNIKIRYIIGTSTGALSAVMYACDIDLKMWYNSYYIIKENITKNDIKQQIDQEYTTSTDVSNIISNTIKRAIPINTHFKESIILFSNFFASSAGFLTSSVVVVVVVVVAGTEGTVTVTGTAATAGTPGTDTAAVVVVAATC